VKHCVCADVVQLRFGMFSNPDEVAKVRETVKTPLFKSTAVEEPFTDCLGREEWYECQRCHSVWRFVPPDPPFTGVWEQVRPPRALEGG
jgi:hypothetical protein